MDIVHAFFLGLISSTFCFVGGSFLIYKYFFKNHGKVLRGSVVGIEKFLSRSTKNQSKQTMYRPLIQYYFKGSNYKFVGHGRNEIVYRIGQPVKVYSLEKGPEYVMLDSSVYNIFGGAFFIGGCVSGYIFFFKSGVAEQTLLGLGLIYLVGLIAITLFLKSKGFLSLIMDGLLKTKLETDETLKGREIFTSKSNIQKERSKNAYLGLIITSVFTLFDSVALYICYNKLTSEQQSLLWDTFSNFELIPELLEVAKQGPLAGVLITLFMLPLMLHSFLYSLKKLN